MSTSGFDDKSTGPGSSDRDGYGRDSYGQDAAGGDAYGNAYGNPHGGDVHGNQGYGPPAVGLGNDRPSVHYGAGDGPGHLPPRNGLGIAALVVGILALLAIITVIGGVLLGLVAIVLGVLGRGRAKRGEATNGGMAMTGLVLGAIALLASGALLALGAALWNSDEAKDFRSCVNDAKNDRAAIERCEQQFNQNVNG